MNKILVAIVEPNQVLLEGFVGILKMSEGIEVISYSISGNTIVNIAQNQKIDVLITDLNSADIDAMKLTALMVESQPDCKIIVNGLIDPGPLVKPLLLLGVSTYFLKHSVTPERLIRIIVDVNNTGFSYTNIVTQHVLMKALDIENDQSIPEFNERELQILKYLCKGFSKKDIGISLCVSEATVKYHMIKLFEKSEVCSTLELVIKALNSSWIASVRARNRFYYSTTDSSKTLKVD